MAIFTDKDKGFKRLMTSFKHVEGETVAFAGFLRSAGTHKPKEGDKPATPITMAALAAAMEYGVESQNIPPRPFFSNALKTHEKDIRKLLEKGHIAVLSGKLDPKKALGVVAQKVVDWIKDSIASNTPPPNKPATVAAKGSDKTLIDSGQLLASVDWDFSEMMGKK